MRAKTQTKNSLCLLRTARRFLPNKSLLRDVKNKPKPWKINFGMPSLKTAELLLRYCQKNLFARIPMRAKR